MRHVLIGLAVGIGAALLSVPHAEASSFMTITVGGSSVTCNNSTAASLALCPTSFTTAVGANFMNFTGTVGGYSFGGGGTTGIELTSNNPGTADLAETIASLTNVSHNNNSGGPTAQIDYGVNFFTLPTGPSTLSASNSGTMTRGAAGDAETFRSWERNDNTLAAGPAGTTAVSIANPCTFTAGAPPTQACMGSTMVLGSPNVTMPFALTSQEIITTSVNFVGSFTGNTDLTPVASPEPSSLVLLGTGLLVVAGRQFRKSRNRK